MTDKEFYNFLALFSPPIPDRNAGLISIIDVLSAPLSRVYGRGAFGETYEFNLHNLSFPPTNRSAIYGFVRKNHAYTDRILFGDYTPLYFGKTTQRVCDRASPSHEKFDSAMRLGATHLVAMPVESHFLDLIESDLIAVYRPVLNFSGGALANLFEK